MYGRMTDHINRPTVVTMNIKTTASSFAESRWKQVVKIFASVASLQMSRFWLKQNCRLQSSHVPGIAPPISDGESSVEGRCPVRGMIVLLEKHIHLQKDALAVNY